MARVQARRRRVLVVDDDPATVDWLKMVIEQAPVEPAFEVRSAGLGRTGEAVFDEWLPEIVLLDLLLPDGDGLDLLKRMKARAPGTEVCVDPNPERECASLPATGDLPHSSASRAAARLPAPGICPFLVSISGK